MMDYKAAAIKLWEILDEIDTYSDVYKPSVSDGASCAPYINAVARAHQQRFQIFVSNGYDLFEATPNGVGERVTSKYPEELGDLPMP